MAIAVNALSRTQKHPGPIFVELALLILYFATRLVNLTLWPMFLDESTHISWAIEMANSGRWLGITDAGKFLPIWIMTLFVPLAGNLLWVERMVSVYLGVFGLLGCYWLGRRLFDRKVGLIAAGLYLVTPYIFFYNRAALADSLLTTLAIYAAFFSLGVVRYQRVREGIGLGIVLALAISTKLNGAMLCAIPLIVAGAYLFRPAKAPPWKLLLLAYAIAALGFMPLMVESSGDFLASIHWRKEARKNMIGEAGIILWQAWLDNIMLVLRAFASYLSPSLSIVAGLGAVLAIIRRRRDELMLVGMAGMIVALFVGMTQPGRFYPRYLLPVTPFLLLIAARAIASGANKLSGYRGRLGSGGLYAIAAGLLLIIILPGLWFNYWLVVDPARAPLLEIDQYQYINGKPSGYGLPGAAAFLRDELSHSGNIVITFDESSESWPGDGIHVYLYDQRERIVYLKADFSQQNPGNLVQRLSKVQDTPVFVVLRYPFEETESPIDFDTWPYARHAARFDKPDGLHGVNVYQLSSNFAN